MAKDKYRTKNGIVVILDALGVRNMTMDQSRDFIRRRDELLSDFSSNRKSITADASRIKSAIGEPESVPKPKSTTFGDTIVITWEHKKRPEISLTFFSLNWLSGAIFQCLLKGPLLRGAIAIGEYIHEKSTVLGPAVVDAAEWYEAAEWVGLIATPSAGNSLSQYVDQMRDGGDFMSHFPAWFVEYNVPLKNKRGSRSKKLLWTVPWPFHFWQAQQKAGIPPDQAFEKVISRYKREPKDEPKYENTREFLHWYQQNIMPGLPVPPNMRMAQ